MSNPDSKIGGKSRLDSKSPLLVAALEYHQRGWSIIPLEPKGKRPLVPWNSFISTTPTRHQVKEWWTKWPEANIGCVCGRVSNLVVVDVDVYRGGTIQGLPTTGLVSKTGGGGYHCFYTYPRGRREKVRNKVGKDGIDVRGDGGYVVLPPSIHANGTPYRWTNGTSNGDLSPCPTFCYEKPKEKKDDTSKDSWISDLLIKGTSKGSRNDDVSRLAGYLASKDLPPDISENIIFAWMRSQDLPLSKEEINVTTRSVYRTKERNALGEDFTVLRLQDYFRKYAGTEIEWLVDGWLPKSTIGFVASPPGGMKTWLIFDLAASIATGKPFLQKFPVMNTGPVLIFQQEDFHGQIADRLGTVLSSKLLTVKGNFLEEEGETFKVSIPDFSKIPIYLHPERALRFDNKDSVASFRQIVERIKPSLVIVDPLYSAVSPEDYMTQGASQMFVMKKLRDEFGTSFFVVHHTKKQREGNLERQDMWGSQFLNAFLETGWQVKKPDEAENSIIVRRHFKVTGPQPVIKLDFNISTHSSYAYSVSVEDNYEEKEALDLPNEILMFCMGKSYSMRELVSKFGDEKKVKNAVKKLRKEGELECKNHMYKTTVNL